PYHTLYFSYFFFLLLPPPPTSTLFPYTTLFRSNRFSRINFFNRLYESVVLMLIFSQSGFLSIVLLFVIVTNVHSLLNFFFKYDSDRKSTRLNSSHVSISYAVFCLKNKK